MNTFWEERNEELLDLWCRFDGGPQVPPKFPALYHDQDASDELVVLGLNPSETFHEIEQFRWTNDRGKLEDLLVLINKKYAGVESRWTRRMAKFAGECGASSISQIDMFRITDSNARNTLDTLGWEGRGGRFTKPFSDAHVQHTKEIITKLHPKVLVIASVPVRDIVKSCWDVKPYGQQGERYDEYLLGDTFIVTLGMWWKGTIPVPVKNRVVDRIKELMQKSA